MSQCICLLYSTYSSFILIYSETASLSQMNSIQVEATHCWIFHSQKTDSSLVKTIISWDLMQRCQSDSKKDEGILKGVYFVLLVVMFYHCMYKAYYIIHNMINILFLIHNNYYNIVTDIRGIVQLNHSRCSTV